MDIGERATSVLAEPMPCAVPEVERVAQTLGITCQKVFERAYARIQHPLSFARAVFVRYIATKRDERVLPEPVRDYCAKFLNKLNGAHLTKKGVCCGCMLEPGALAGLARAYSLIHPESERTDVQRKPEEQFGLPLLETLWLDLVDSGALDQQDETSEE